MSLLSAPHVSQANALIHSAYLSSICLHYNHTGIIGFPLCSQIDTFISESFPRAGFCLVLATPEMHSQTGTYTARRPHPCDLKSSPRTRENKSCHCPPHGEVIENTARGGGGGDGEGERCCQTASATNQIILHCCVKFQMTSKDVFFFPFV